MTKQEKQEVISILKESGWTENRNVDPTNFRCYTSGDWKVKDYGQSFYMFDKAREFLSSYGGLTIKWDIPNDSYNYELFVALQKKRKKVADRMQKDIPVYICTNCIFMRE